MKKTLIAILAICLTLALAAPLSAQAASPEPVGYLPGVTKEMTDSAYWSGRMADPDALLAAPEEISRINAAALTTSGANMHDLRNLPATFDGDARNASLKRGAEADAAYYLGWVYDSTGKKMTKEDLDAIVDNCFDRRATADMPVRYGVAVKRTELLVFPYDGQILDDPADFDFDYQALVGIRVNEPVALYTTSADGKYYQAFTSNCSGWVRAEDVAVCADREEWLSAWDIPAGKRLVFWGDKMYTDYSKTAPETSHRLITMGTVLERMDALETGALVTNRQPLHNYAVYLPVRNEDGSYAKVPALINARERVSEDYLPLTGTNLAKVALASLGDAYGWGGSLLNEDCTSLDRNVYSCFGLDLPRNGNWQWPLAMPKADAAYMTTEEKLAMLDALPLGTLLNFPGHQMMYLGKVNGGYYVVSTVSSMMNPVTGKRQRTRDVQINQLDVKRANGQTWIQAVNRMYIPWRYLAEGVADPMPALPWYHEGTAFCLERKAIDTEAGGYFRPGEAATRAVFTEALWRLAGKPEPAEGTEKFPDVESGAGFEKAALWAREKGIVLGTRNGFEPQGRLTRQQMAAMLFRCAGALGFDTSARAELTGFADAGEISSWAKDAMGWAVAAGLFRGNSAGKLNPGAVASRAEAAVILQRAAGLASAQKNEGSAADASSAG